MLGESRWSIERQKPRSRKRGFCIGIDGNQVPCQTSEPDGAVTPEQLLDATSLANWFCP